MKCHKCAEDNPKNTKFCTRCGTLIKGAPPLPAPNSESETFVSVDIGRFILWSVLTLGIYLFFIQMRWARHINGMLGWKKYNPGLVLILSIVTCGLASYIWNILMAYDIQKITAGDSIKGRNPSLGNTVLFIDITALILGFFSAGVLLVLSIVLGTYAAVAIQKEFNNIVEVNA